MKRNRPNYPMGTTSHATMRPEDLIPAFCSELEYQAKRPGILSRKQRDAHLRIVKDIEKRSEVNGYYDSDDASYDLNETLFDALGEYAGPYFYFGAHPGDGSDYGFWLSEMWDEDFDGLKVDDLAEVPKDYRGEVVVVNDHGNVSLYVKGSRTIREVWSVV